MKRAAVFIFVLLQLFCPLFRAQEMPAPAGTVVDRTFADRTLVDRTMADRAAAIRTVPGRTMVVIPFENDSPTPGLEWLGESFSEAFHQQLNSPVLYVASRGERLRAYDRVGVPAGVHASRATLYRIAEQIDVDYAVLGSYKYDGALLAATAQLLDMRAQRLLPVVTESAPLSALGNLQSALAWDLLRLIRPDFSLPKDKYILGVALVRLDAQENYIRGLLAPTAEEKVQHYREAVHLDPDYAEAWLELGKSYYAQHTYDLAIAALGQVQHTSVMPAASVSNAMTSSTTMPGAVTSGALISGELAREANFYLGLAAYAHGDFAKSESAFEFVGARLPLAEVYNNLGVVAARRGQGKTSIDYFERAIQNDPSDPDYHFNLAATLARAGDRAGAARELHAALDHRPNDAEAKSLLDGFAVPGSIVPSSAISKAPSERIKRDYEEDAFRQMTTQMGGWAEQRFARSDPRTHARYHVELGRELLAHGFTSEAETEFRHAAAVDPSNPAPLAALAEDYEARGDAREARMQAEAALRIRESAEAYLILARLDLRENRTEAAGRNIGRALELEPGNTSGQELKRTLTSKLAEKAQPISAP